MKYKILQLKNNIDSKYRFMPWHYAEGKFNINDYEVVYEGNIEPKDPTRETSDIDYLEHLFFVFNVEHPADFKGHSLSVSDVVELEGVGKFYCDSAGWKKLN